MQREGQTVIYLHPTLREPLDEVIRRFGVQNRVINAAIWMFLTSTPEQQDRAMDAIPLARPGRKKKRATLDLGTTKAVVQDMRPAGPKTRRQKAGG